MTDADTPEPSERGWTDDVDERRARRPKQQISPEEGASGGGMTITPAWRWACQECGHERRLASEATFGWDRCPECDEVTMYRPLGELVYPDHPDDAEVALKTLHRRFTTLEHAVEAAVHELRADSRPGQKERQIADELETALNDADDVHADAQAARAEGGDST